MEQTNTAQQKRNFLETTEFQLESTGTSIPVPLDGKDIADFFVGLADSQFPRYIEMIKNPDFEEDKPYNLGILRTATALAKATPGTKQHARLKDELGLRYCMKSAEYWSSGKDEFASEEDINLGKILAEDIQRQLNSLTINPNDKPEKEDYQRLCSVLKQVYQKRISEQ